MAKRSSTLSPGARNRLAGNECPSRTPAIDGFAFMPAIQVAAPARHGILESCARMLESPEDSTGAGRRLMLISALLPGKATNRLRRPGDARFLKTTAARLLLDLEETTGKWQMGVLSSSRGVGPPACRLPISRLRRAHGRGLRLVFLYYFVKLLPNLV